MFSDVTKSPTTVSTSRSEWFVDSSQITIPDTPPKQRMQFLTTLLSSSKPPYSLDSHDLSTLKKWIEEANSQMAITTLDLVLSLLSKVVWLKFC